MLTVRAIAGLMIAVSLGPILAGCGSAATPDTPLTFDSLLSQAKGDGGAEQVAMLEDGVLTTAELESAIDAMFKCFDSEGIWHDYEGVNPVDGWRPLYGVNVENRDAVDTCERTNYRYIELGYELLNEDVMDPGLMAIVQDCLAARDMEVSGEEKNLSDLAPNGAEDAIRIEAIRVCASSEPERFPSLMFVYE